MTAVQDMTMDAAVGVGIVNNPEELSVFRRPDCAAAIWRRQPSPAFQHWIDGLEEERLPETRLALRPADVHEAVAQVCDLSGTPDCPERQRLVDDAAALSAIFAALTEATYVRLRLSVISTDACRKFHKDYVAARLICTYRGTGTQYGIAADGDEPRRVFTVPTGAPILLRGKLWPERPDSGLLHRSPPIDGTGETRLVLVLDPTDRGGDLGVLA